MGQLHTSVLGDIKSTAGPNGSWNYATGTQIWKNPYPQAIYIYRCWVLMGVQGGIDAHDYSVKVWIDDPPNGVSEIIAVNTTDHQGNMNGQHISFTEDKTIEWHSPTCYYLVPAGGNVYWSSSCTLYTDTGAKLIETAPRIAYTIGAP